MFDFSRSLQVDNRVGYYDGEQGKEEEPVNKVTPQD